MSGWGISLLSEVAEPEHAQQLQGQWTLPHLCDSCESQGEGFHRQEKQRNTVKSTTVEKELANLKNV